MMHGSSDYAIYGAIGRNQQIGFVWIDVAPAMREFPDIAAEINHD